MFNIIIGILIVVYFLCGFGFEKIYDQIPDSETRADFPAFALIVLWPAILIVQSFISNRN